MFEATARRQNVQAGATPAATDQKRTRTFRAPDRLRRLKAGAAGAALTLAATVAPLNPAIAAEQLFGLIIGIDDYVGDINDLEGAVNDAEGIAAALTDFGATEVNLFIDGEATKAAIEQTWDRLVNQAQAGDTIVLTYAGHGSQEPERPGLEAEADGKNENFLLAGYEESGPGTLERIVDDEVNAWLLQADRKGVEVVFVADSCHSGTMFRSAGSTKIRYRTGRFVDPDLENDLLEFPGPAAASISEDEFKGVTFISATQEDRLTPEFVIDGVPHGALSWAFAKAIRGAADRDGDGDLTQQELLGYLVPTVQAEAENQQIPAILPLRPDAKPILRSVRSPEPAPTPAPPPPPPPEPVFDPSHIRLFVVGDAPAGSTRVSGVDVVLDEAHADLIWDVAAGTVDHRVGGRVADGIDGNGIAAVLSKWSALTFIKARTSDFPVIVSTPSGNQTYKVGDIVDVAIDGMALPHLTLFNMPPNGRVEFFIPANAAETNMDWRQRPFAERFQVTRPPFGAEHLVAILTEEPALALHEALRSMPTAATAGGLAATLRSLLGDVHFQAGVASIYTAGSP